MPSPQDEHEHELDPGRELEHDHELDPGRDEAVAIELNSEPPVPYQMEQFLETQTNEISCNNNNSADKREIPNTPPHSTGDTSEPNSTVDDGDVRTTGSSSGYSSSDEGYSSSSSDVSTITTVTGTSTTAATRSRGNRCRRRQRRGEGSVLVLLGCRSCLTYFMVEKTALECPGCGGGDDAGGLIRFGG